MDQLHKQRDKERLAWRDQAEDNLDLNLKKKKKQKKLSKKLRNTYSFLLLGCNEGNHRLVIINVEIKNVHLLHICL